MDFSLLLWLISLAASNRRVLGVAIVACLLGSLTVWSNVGLLATSAWLITAAALHPPVAELSVAIVGVRFFGLSRAVFRYLERYISHNATFRLLAHIRVWLYTALEPLVPAGLAGYGKGDIFSRLVADVETLKFFYLRAVFPGVIALLVTAGTVGFIAWLAPQLVWPAAGMLLLVAVGLPLITGGLGRQAGHRAVADRANLTISLADSIDGLTELAAFDRVASQAATVAAVNTKLIASQQRVNGITILADTLGHLGMNVTVIVVIALAVPLVRANELTGIYLATLALTVQGSFEAILPLPAVIYYLEESVAAAGRLLAIAGRRPTIASHLMAAVPPGLPEIVASGLCFSYRPELPPALSDISFALTPGKRLAIVGPSGAGKSTLAGLLLRFWDYGYGSLLLDGREIRDYAPEDVRRLFGVVSQDTYLFNTTVRDNILLAKPDASQAEFDWAIAGAMLGELIARLPAGLDTMTGQNGMALSGGERQRIAIARALLKDAPVWLLDEPTAGLDAAAEAAVMDTILQATNGRTVILITHRLLGLETMDEILVLCGGSIAERGSQAGLLAERGLFHRLWQFQHDLLKTS